MLASQHEVGNIPEERQAWRTRGKIPPAHPVPQVEQQANHHHQQHCSRAHHRQLKRGTG